MGHSSFLANERVKEIFSRGAGATDEAAALFQETFSGASESLLANAAKDFELLDKHTFNTCPSIRGVYLKLLHGRSPSDQNLDTWGDDGPWIGPLKWFHCTYLSTFSVGFAGGEEYLFSSDIKIPSPLYFYNDMIYYGGMYYGQWEIQAFD